MKLTIKIIIFTGELVLTLILNQKKNTVVYKLSCKIEFILEKINIILEIGRIKD